MENAENDFAPADSKAPIFRAEPEDGKRDTLMDADLSDTAKLLALARAETAEEGKS